MQLEKCWHLDHNTRTKWRADSSCSCIRNLLHIIFQNILFCMAMWAQFTFCLNSKNLMFVAFRIPGVCPLFKHRRPFAHRAGVNVQWRGSAFIRAKDREMPELLRRWKGKSVFLHAGPILSADSDNTRIACENFRWCARHASALGWLWQASTTPGSIPLSEARVQELLYRVEAACVDSIASTNESRIGHE